MIPSGARDFVISPRCFVPSILSSSILIPPMFLTFLFFFFIQPFFFFSRHFLFDGDYERIPPNTAIIILFSPHSFFPSIYLSTFGSPHTPTTTYYSSALL